MPSADGAARYDWYPDRGRRRFDECVNFCRSIDGAHDGLVRMMLAPGQVDTCDKEMLEETRRVADASGLPIQLHAGQSPAEYRRIQEQHGMSTLQFLSETGLLGDDFMIGHGMYLTQSGIVDQFPPAELGILIESGTTLVHLPWVKARQGAQCAPLVPSAAPA